MNQDLNSTLIEGVITHKNGYAGTIRIRSGNDVEVEFDAVLCDKIANRVFIHDEAPVGSRVRIVGRLARNEGNLVVSVQHLDLVRQHAEMFEAQGRCPDCGGSGGIDGNCPACFGTGSAV